jgi:hypothetical protein
MAKKTGYHTRAEIDKTCAEGKARDNLSGDFAGDVNDRKNSIHLKDRKLPKNSGKTPKR